MIIRSRSIWRIVGFCVWLIYLFGNSSIVSAEAVPTNIQQGIQPYIIRGQIIERGQSGYPLYVIRGHVYTYGSSNGLANAQVKVEFEVYDDPMSVPRTIVLPPTGADGAWEFDERDHELSGGLGCPCPGSPVTLEVQ